MSKDNGEIIIIPTKDDEIKALKAENLALRARILELETEVEELRPYKADNLECRQEIRDFLGLVIE
ncbi:MAG: hypothetical protein ACK5BE_02210 [Alphaproteobacteria bacterium]